MDESFVLRLIVAAFVGGAAAYLGSLMITRRMALVGDALGHVALPGMGLALLFGIDVAFGAVASLAVGIVIIWHLGERTRLSMETLVGVVFVSSLALGFLIVPQPELLDSLFGDITRITLPDAIAAVVLSIVLFATVRHIYPGMMLLGISPDLASVEGIAARRYNLVYLSAVALIVAIGVKITGSLLVGALIILPPATARMITNNMQQYALGSAVIGVFASVAGIIASQLSGFPSGPSIILAGAILFLLALGWDSYDKKIRND